MFGLHMGWSIMNRLRIFSALLLCMVVSPIARAGLYYSGEPLADLPSQWRGFLLDQRSLRMAAIKSVTPPSGNPLRTRYEEAVRKLEASDREQKLSADEKADLGALYVRLGNPARAVEFLRKAQQQHRSHFRIVANLGTAWQLQGELGQAAASLQEAVRLAPGNLQKPEELQLRLVRLRQRETRDAQELDDLFGVRFMNEAGKYEPGKIAKSQRDKLPSDAVANVQRLALWLPADGRLLWQLAELANAHGDVKTAAAIMDGCVTEFGMQSRTVREHRQMVRAAAEELAKAGDAKTESAKSTHEGGHVTPIRARSKRPLANRLDTADLPAISATGVNSLPWSVLADTSIDRQFRPGFAKYLQDLEGKQVSLTGFIQPLNEELELATFMFIEYPVGCWYCEMPEVTSILFVELPEGKSFTYTRGLVKVTGRLSLNKGNPESFLYTLNKAKVAEAD